MSASAYNEINARACEFIKNYGYDKLGEVKWVCEVKNDFNPQKSFSLQYANLERKGNIFVLSLSIKQNLICGGAK